MVFNLSKQRHFMNKGIGEDILSNTYSGPHFGQAELSALFEPFNGEGKCRSYANQSSFGIPKEGRINMLTNKENGYLTITELEVWQVREIKG